MSERKRQTDRETEYLDFIVMSERKRQTET